MASVPSSSSTAESVAVGPANEVLENSASVPASTAARKSCQGLPLEKRLVAKQHANRPWRMLLGVGQIVERFDGFRHAP